MRPTEIGEKILISSRNALYLQMRFLNLALNVMSYQPEEGNGYVGCDGEKIYYNSGHLMNLYERTPVLVHRLYYHMIVHCLFRHIWKRDQRDHRLWNLACDIAVESLVDAGEAACLRMRIPAYRSMIYGELQRKMKVATAEKIYLWLLEKSMDEMELARLEAEFLTDDHTFWYRKENQKQSSQTSQNWKDVSTKTQTSMETLSRGQDSSGGTMRSSLEFEHRERYDYRAFLRKFAIYKEELGLDPEAFDTTFYTLGLQMYGNMPLIEPLEQREVKRIQDFVLAVDTSLSCPEELIKAFLRETCQILKSTESFFKEVRIHVIQCDTKIQRVDEIRNQEDLETYMRSFEIQGRGGTDFRPAFVHVEQMRQQGLFSNLKGMIYFTDGMGTYPGKPPAWETAFVFLEESSESVQVPPWAIRLYVPELEINRR